MVRNLLSGWVLARFSPTQAEGLSIFSSDLMPMETRHDETDRPALANGQVAGRNTGKGPTLSRRICASRVASGSHADGARNLELIAEAFNLFNRTTFPGKQRRRSDFDQLRCRRSAWLTNVALGFTSAADPSRSVRREVELLIIRRAL